MDVYVYRKMNEDVRVSDVVALNAYGNSEVYCLHVIDSADEGSIFFDVIKFEVF